MGYLILVINPGSTTTKLAVYNNEREKVSSSIEHNSQELQALGSIINQLSLRIKAVVDFLDKNNIKTTELSVIAARGGLLPSVKSGAYVVNEKMVKTLIQAPAGEHAANLGAVIAREIASPLGLKAYIYDAVAIDEMEEVAKFTGLSGVTRSSLVHNLNMRAAARETAVKDKVNYNQATYVIAHLGGGISIGLLKKGRMIDVVSDDEGPMSPERAGRIPALQMLGICLKNQEEKDVMQRKLRGQGGLVSHLNSNNAQEVEKRIQDGDMYAAKVYRAMAYQIAKGIGELVAAASGKVDKIILTGGMANSKMLTGWVKKRIVSFAPVTIIPGENEMRALAQGAFRVLTGQEKARQYK